VIITRSNRENVMPQAHAPTITAINVRTCLVPLDPPVQTASGEVAVAPLALIDITTSDGVAGSTYLFTYTPLALKPIADLLRNMARLVIGQRLAPIEIHDMLIKRFRLLGTEGLVLMAIAGIDMALWDALATSHSLPLARLLGGEPKPIPAYASLRTMRPDDIRREVEALAQKGFQAFKIKVGWPDVADDMAAVRALRAEVGEHMKIMVDYNQSLSVPEAKRRVRLFDELGLAWIEEPTLMSDLAGQSEIRRLARTPIQAGENWWGPHDAAKSIAAGATDLMMPDAMKIGGVTGWMRTAALADAAGMPVSSHIFPEISVHLLAVTPGAHWLEYLDLAGPILINPVLIKDGNAIPSNEPGTGISWNERAVAKYLIQSECT
jgi:mandelate racemase